MILRDHFALIYKDLTATLHDFSRGSRQTRQALKTALACVMSVTLTYFLDLKEAYWAAITIGVLVSLARSQEDFRLLFSRLGEREREFQQIIDDMSQEAVIFSKPMAFNQQFAHTLIICKHLIYRLRALAEARIVMGVALLGG